MFQKLLARTGFALMLAALVAGTAAPAFAGATTTSSKLGGTWAGSYTGRYAGTFTIHWTQTRSRLNGTIALSNPHGTYTITGSVNGTGIKFGAVGVGALYSGSVSASGTSMSGNWTSGPAKGSWKAHKVLTRSPAGVAS
jgi:hypothetical protein